MKLSKRLVILLVVLFTLISCSKFELQDINEYKVNEKASKKRIPLKLLCTHGGKEIKNDKEYYYQTIAIDKETSDTITILSEEITAFDQLDIEKAEFISVYSEDKSDLLVFEIMNNQNIDKIGNINNLKTKPYKKLSKVSFNNKFKEYDGRNYPAVIGLIVQTEKNNF